MKHVIAIFRAGKCVELLETDRDPGKDIERKRYERAVIVTGRPDVRVGTTWPICTEAEYRAKLKAQEPPTPEAETPAETR